MIRQKHDVLRIKNGFIRQNHDKKGRPGIGTVLMPGLRSGDRLGAWPDAWPWTDSVPGLRSGNFYGSIGSLMMMQ